ncbi:MAG TPA: serine/threonine-protein kinase [Polyangiaceae bacterium]|nr:serine/threonine-protein kinase [Polyangiaceae bacterium]
MTEPVAVTRGLPSSIREGEILGGKYRLEQEIGRGSMGTVWSAVHLTLGQRVAIKLIAAEHAQSLEARQRFSTEAKAAARLRSRYVVQVYDDGETPEGTPFIVLEYLDGETLEQRLERERDLPLNEAVRVTRHVARALSRAHASGIVHRDLKPGNVFLTRSEDDELGWLAKVLDFGIAKFEEHGVDSTTKTGALLGTPLFMSPEQIRGANSVDSRSDLYSLGMVFYNMVTGGYAFNGDSFADVLVAICTGPLPDLRAAAPWVPASVADWFQRTCARDVQQRFQSADELIEGLDLALGVTTGAYARQSSPEVKLETLHGHAPPVHHSMPRASSWDSGQHAKGVTQVLSTDQALLQAHPEKHAPALDADEPTFASSSRKRWLVAGLVALLALFTGAALLFGRDRGVQATSEIAPATTGLAASAPIVSPLPSVPEPAPPPAVALETSISSAAPAEPNRIRAAATKPAAAPPSAAPPSPRNNSASKGVPARAVSPRSTNTDIGF